VAEILTSQTYLRGVFAPFSVRWPELDRGSCRRLQGGMARAPGQRCDAQRLPVQWFTRSTSRQILFRWEDPLKLSEAGTESTWLPPKVE